MGLFSFIGNAIGDVVGGITGAKQQAKAAQQAATIEGQAAQAGIDESRRQFDTIIKLMEPFVTGGQSAMTAQQALLGLGGADAQTQAIQGIQAGPEFQALLKEGENSILRNASATGGLRGGNTQAALAEFSPNLLSTLIQQRFQNLGSLTNVGQASAAGQANAGLTTSANIGNLRTQQGSATAGGVLARGSVNRTAFGDLLKIGGTIAGGF